MIQFDDLVRNYRIRIRRISQETMADELGIRRSTLADWERRKSFPNLENLRKVCALLGVKTSDIEFPPRKD